MLLSRFSRKKIPSLAFAILVSILCVAAVAEDPDMKESAPILRSETIRKTNDELQHLAAKRVEPVLPKLLKGTRLMDFVDVAVTVDEQGSVLSARAVWGNSLLKDAAADAARGWKFRPTRDKGNPVKVAGVIKFDFQTEGSTLGQKEIDYHKQDVLSRPNSPQAHYNLGKFYYWDNRRQEALEEYKRAIEIEPEFIVAHYGLAEAYFRLLRFQEAIDAYRHVIHLKPDYVEAYLGMGWCYERLNLNAEAIDGFSQALSVRPDPDVSSVAYTNIAQIYERMGRIEDAIRAYEHLVTTQRELMVINPDYPKQPEHWANHVASMYEKINRNEDAIEAYKTVISIAPYSDEAFYAHLSIASLYKKAGRNEEASKVYEQMIEITNESMRRGKGNSDVIRQGHYAFGLIYQEMGRDKEAIEAYKRATKIRRDWVKPHVALAKLYYKLGDKESAMKEYLIVKQIDEEMAEEIRRVRDAMKKN